MKTLYLFGVCLLGCLPILSAQWDFQGGVLNNPRFNCGAGATAHHAFFVAGNTYGLQPLGTVEVYNAELDDWTVTYIGARALPTVVANDSLVLMAGGVDYQSTNEFDQVDIYNPNTDQTFGEKLSVARAEMGGAICGGKAFFAGGSSVSISFDLEEVYNIIDIYDIETGEWTLDTLSQARGGIAAASNGTVVLFAGGYLVGAPHATSRVDIFDTQLGTWETTELSEPKMYASAVSIGEYIIIAGGNTNDEPALASVDIYHVPSKTWTTSALQYPRSYIAAGGLGNKAYFAGGGNVDWANLNFTTASNWVEIYNVATGQWESPVQMGHKRTGTAAAVVENKFIVASGYDPQVGLYNSIDVYTDTTLVSGTNILPEMSGNVLILPNPASTEIFLETGATHPVFLQILSVKGEVLLSNENYLSTDPFDIAGLPSGIYMALVVKGSEVWTGRFVKK